MACSKAPGPDGNAPAPVESRHWVGTWGAAPQLTEPGNLPPAPGLSENTLRQVVRVSLGGSQLRVKFSNEYGRRPLELRAARIAVPAGRDAVDSRTERALSFGREASIAIQPGNTATSDPVDFELAPLSELSVSVSFGEVREDVTGHPGSRTTSYIAEGDATARPALPGAVTTEHWYFLTGIDVLASRPASAVVTLGDSITDGRGSTTDGNDRWPDVLASRLWEDDRTRGVAVVNQGIGGNAVLSGGLGPTAAARFGRDVLGQSGVRFVIVLAGVNDIGASDDAGIAPRLIAAYETFIEQAHSENVLIYGGTILPFGGSQYASAEHEAARQSVNQWIRTSGRFDAVIDFDAALRDPAHPNRLLPAYDTGDHLHLNPAGYRRVAEAIDLGLFVR